jgi:hypothetical protein
MSKYKSKDERITRREACTILDQRRFDGAVRSGVLVSHGKDGAAGKTSPLLFNQEAVRALAKAVADELTVEGTELRKAAKRIAKRTPPLTRRQIAAEIGKTQTGILIRCGALQPDGVLTDTQTAAHTYAPDHVGEVIADLADAKTAEGRLFRASSKVRVPA